MKNKYTIDVFDAKDIKANSVEIPEELNVYITETAGYIPLEVKFKQFEQNGYIAQFQEKDFTSNDYRNLYLNPDFDITPEDDYEDVMEKLDALHKYQEEYKAKIAKSNGGDDLAGTEEPKEENKEVAEPEKA